MARRTTAAKKAATKSPRTSRTTSRAAAADTDQPEAQTETDSDMRQAARDSTDTEDASFGTTPYTAGGPNIKTGQVDKMIAMGERSRFPR